MIAVDVGNHAYSFGRYFESAGQPVLMSGYLGSIGFGYPAAMGAWAADPTRPVVAVTGDGGFGQYLAELTTAVKYGIPIKHVLLDNGALGKISKEQLAGGLPVWQTSLVNPDFAAYARLCGAVGIPVDTQRRARRRHGRAVRRRRARRCCTSTPTASSSEPDGAASRRRFLDLVADSPGVRDCRRPDRGWDGGQPDRGSAQHERARRGVDRELVGAATPSAAG